MKNHNAEKVRAKLSRVAEEWAGCKNCELHVARSHMVHWRGSPTARVAVIGEAPGECEDRTGEPFVGSAGRLLDQVLQEAGLSSVFICNLCACKPMGNRDPEPEEVRACRPRLDAMLAAVRPRVLVLAGRVASWYLVGAKPITGWRGRVLTCDIVWKRQRGLSFPAVLTFHPSYVLRSGGSTYEQIVSDLKLAKGLSRA